MLCEFSNVGARILSKAKELNLKQIDICNISHISANAISQYITGKRIPDTLSLYKISIALKTPMEWLLTGNTTTENVSPLNFDESDLIEMYRALDDRDKNDAFEILKLKYERSLNKNGFTYSHQESDTDSGDNTADGIA